ncbi:MAG TPA: phosphotransferase [Drouetiella sp.]
MSTEFNLSSLIATIEQNYDLPEILDVEKLSSLRDDIPDDEATYKVITTARAFVLRPYRTKDARAIELHNSFIKWAEQGNFERIQKLILNRQRGESFDYLNRRWWLSEFIEARVLSWGQPINSLWDCEMAGKSLAELHIALKKFADKESLTPLNYPQSIAPIDKGLESSIRKILMSEPEYEHIADGAVEVLASPLQLIRNRDESTMQLIHGDFHPGNILFGDEDVEAIIDFEYLHFDDPMFDLAYAAIMCCVNWSKGLDDGTVMTSELRSLMRGYTHAAGPKVDENLLHAYMIVSAMVNFAWCIEKDSERSNSEHFYFLAAKLVSDVSNILERITF